MNTHLKLPTESQPKTRLRPSRQAIKRVALAVALALSVAGAADFGHYYLTTGRYLQTTDDRAVNSRAIVTPGGAVFATETG